MSSWGNIDRAADRPKYANTDGSALYGNTYGVTDAEAVSANSNVKGVHSGWVAVKSYSDVHGTVRYKAETLVAMSSIEGEEAATLGAALSGTVDVTGNTVTGTLTSFTTELTVGDSIAFDSSDDVYVVKTITDNTNLGLEDGVSLDYTGVQIFRATDIRDDPFFKG